MACANFRRGDGVSGMLLSLDGLETLKRARLAERSDYAQAIRRLEEMASVQEADPESLRRLRRFVRRGHSGLRTGNELPK